MNNLQEKVTHLWDDLEENYRPTLTARDYTELRALDDAATDGTLTPARFKQTRDNLRANRRRTYAATGTGSVDPTFQSHRARREGELFGDYELIIDQCLGGDQKIKDAVKAADNKGRRGLATLKYHLGRSKAKLPTALQSILRTCELDQEYHEELEEHSKSDLKNIEERDGRYRVQMTVRGQRRSATFNTLKEAQSGRDAWLVFEGSGKSKYPQIDIH